MVTLSSLGISMRILCLGSQTRTMLGARASPTPEEAATLGGEATAIALMVERQPELQTMIHPAGAPRDAAEEVGAKRVAEGVWGRQGPLSYIGAKRFSCGGRR